MRTPAKHILDRIAKKIGNGMMPEKAYRSEGYILSHKAGAEVVKQPEQKEVVVEVKKEFIPRPKK